jgi:Domain of unknown function (DUF5659)
MTKENVYRTRRLNLAAYLYASGLTLFDAEEINGEYFFIFTPAEKAVDLVDSYYAGNARVNPQDLFARLNDLKDLIFNHQ